MAVRWSEVKEGSGPEPRVLPPVSLTDVVRYQGASGDMNPIHHDPGFAGEAGFDAPLVIGMYQAGVLNSFATDWLGPENVRRTRVRWKQQVWPGDTLTFSGSIAKKYEENGERRVDLDLVCTNQDGAVAVQGWMTFVVPDE